MKKQDFKGAIVFVTGAASGIGRETCLAFARAGADIIATDLTVAALEAVRIAVADIGRECQIHALDVADEQAFSALAAELAAGSRLPHVVVNNAGIAFLGSFMEQGTDTWRRIIDVNLMGVVHGCRAFLPQLLAASDRRHLVNVSSLAAIAPAPNMAAYAAAKSAVQGLNDVLAMELAESMVTVTGVYPGIINTAIAGGSSVGESITADQLSRLQAYYRNHGCHPSVVAADIVDGVRRERSHVFTGPLAKPTRWLKRLLSGRRFRQILLGNARAVGYLPQ